VAENYMMLVPQVEHSSVKRFLCAFVYTYICVWWIVGQISTYIEVRWC